MNKSGRVRLSDLRRAFRLIHECRDVGHLPSAWPVVLVEGLARLVDAQVVIAGKIELESSGGPPRTIPLGSCGWPSPKHRDSWFARCVHQQEHRQFLTFLRFSSLQGNLITRSREQLVSEGEWYRSEEFNGFNKPNDLDDIICSHGRVQGPPSLLGFQIHRRLGQERFGMRERRLTRMFHSELTRSIGTVLVSEPGEPLKSLPTRLRQTLESLLEGDSEKQVAVRLGLSRHTVHEYVKELYRRLGVSSRPELMAFCLRRHAPPTHVREMGE